MSLADDAKLLLIPTGYKTSKVYSVFPTDGDGDFTYTRSGNASRVNPGGLIETISNNIPRIDHTGGGCPTLLLEPQRTNYALNSRQMHLNNTLTASGSTITKTGDYAISPDGTLTATRLQVSGSGSGYALLSVNKTNPSTNLNANGYYMSSVYVKSNTGTTQTIGFYGASTQTSMTHEITTEWQRIEFKGYRPYQAKYSYIGYSASISGIDTNLDFLVWGGQTEIVNSYITSSISTGSSVATRQKDQCLNGGDADLFNISEGTFFIDANNFGTPLNSYSMITISDGTGSEYIRYIYESSRIRVSVLGLGDYFITGVNDNERNKVATTFKENEMKVFFNGSLVHTDTLGVLPTDMDRLNFASQSGTSRHFEGKIHDARVYDRVLTQTEAETLTTL